MRLALVCTISFPLGGILLLVAGGIASAGQPEAEIEHLIKAAAHLDQAGQGQLANDLRELVAAYDDAPKRRLLEAKQVQIAELQAEIQQLQLSLQSPASMQKVVLRLKVLQLSMGKLRALGLDLVSIRQLLNSESPPTLVEDGGEILQFLHFLETQGYAEVVSRPTLVTTDGRSGSLRIDGKADTQAHGASRSVSFECTPTVLTGGRLRLKGCFQNVTFGQSTDADSLEGNIGASPRRPVERGSSKDDAKSSRQAGADFEGVELAPDQTLILARPSSAERAGDDRATLVMLQAELVEPAGT